MADAGAGEKLKVFISYSRKDSTAFADELLAGLEAAGFAPFLDRHDIVPGEPWEARLGGLIEQSDTVVFVVSPEAVKSPQCTWEVDRTIELSKRLLPVIFKWVPDDHIPEKLRRLEYVRFDTEAKFARLFQLAEALRVDLHWIRKHTRYGELARRWDGRGRPESLLLRGEQIDLANRWIATRRAAAPEITDAQRAFIKASEEAEATRLAEKRAQLDAIGRAQDATARQQRRAARLLWSLAILVLATVIYVSWQSYDVARREINVFTARATEALNDEQFDRAMRYALRTYPVRGRLPWTMPFSTELEGKLAGGALSTRLRRQLKGHSQNVVSAAFRGDDKRVLTAALDGTARIWDTESGKEIAALKGQSDAVFSAAFSGDGKQVVTVDGDTAGIWDAESGKEITVLKGHTAYVSSVAFSADGKRVVTASRDETARIWDAESGKEIAILKGHTDSLSGAAFTADGKRVVTASRDEAARIWDTESGKEIVVAIGSVPDQPLPNAAFSGDGKLVVSRPQDHTAHIWNAENGKEIAVLNDCFGFLSSAAFSGDGKRVVTASSDDTARIWDAETGKEIIILKGHTDFVSSAAFSADGKRVVTASRDRTARIWDAESGKEIAVSKDLTTGVVLSLAFSTDGKRVVTASAYGTARIWDAESGKEIAVLKGDPNFVLSAAFSGDGKRVVTAPLFGDARIWDAESGKEIAVLKGHTGSVFSATFSGDGERVLTASSDKTARIWDAESGAAIAVLKGHSGSVRAAAFSGDSKRVLTASSDNTVRIWDVTWATLLRGDILRERVCAEKLISAAQEFTGGELEDPILRGIDKDDPIARNPCLRRGPLSLEFWTRLPGQLWRSTRRLVGVN